MKKFFLFRREKDSISSGSTTSNTGVGISTISIPADSVSYMTTKKGGLVITFNHSSAFEDTFLKEGQSLPKTTVELGCIEGQESALMEEILNFISNPGGKNIMRFDSVGNNSTFGKFIESSSDIRPIVPTLAVDTVSGEISEGDAQDQYRNKIAGINFYGNTPEIDYNHETLSGYANGDTVTTWANSGTGGSTYNIAPGGGTTPSAVPEANQTNFSKAAVTFAAEYFEVPSYTVKNDYTIYAVLGRDNLGLIGTGPLFGDADGETVGFIGSFYENGVIEKSKQSNKNFVMRHDGKTGEVASASVDKFFDDGINKGYDFQPCYSFVIRRDEDLNIYIHDRSGDIIASIPAFVGRDEQPKCTDGNLLIERLGTTNEVVSGNFKGSLARFGVINKDIGSGPASQLSRDLFNFYKL